MMIPLLSAMAECVTNLLLQQITAAAAAAAAAATCQIRFNQHVFYQQ